MAQRQALRTPMDLEVSSSLELVSLLLPPIRLIKMDDLFSLTLSMLEEEQVTMELA